MQCKDYIPEESILNFRNMLEEASDKSYDNLVAVPLKKTVTTLILSIFLGGLAVDRFYIGDVGVGIAKLLLGWLTCGIWAFIDIFLAYKKNKTKKLCKHHFGNKIKTQINGKGVKINSLFK